MGGRNAPAAGDPVRQLFILAQPQASAFPPHKGGGNMDNRHLVEDSTLWLPVWCDGALFSCGDAHASQGDGEVCVSAIECAMRASLRLTVRKRSLSAPSFRVPAAAQLVQRRRGRAPPLRQVDDERHTRFLVAMMTRPLCRRPS